MISTTRLVTITIVLAIIAANSSSSLAFSTTPKKNNKKYAIIHSRLNIFGNAFANDDSLGARENAGLKKGPKVAEVTVNGKPVKAVAGQKVSKVMAAARVKMTYSCQKGNCGTCELLMNGRVEKACVSIISVGKTTIKTY